MSPRGVFFAGLICSTLGLGTRAWAQCTPAWDPGFASTSYAPVPDGPVYASAVFDDGSGPKVYVGGEFTHIGPVLCGGIARWDGEVWSSVGSAWSPPGGSGGSAHTVYALAVFDDGSGPALYAGGYFSIQNGGGTPAKFARWDGTSWSLPGGGTNNSVRALVAHDDGSGVKLYAGGEFTTAGGQPASRVASWDGVSWSTLGSGMSGVTNPSVLALASYDDGTGRKLFAGGRFTTAGGVSANYVARWDGASWSPLGSGITSLPSNGSVLALCVFNDGSTTRLHVGGYFFEVDGMPAKAIAAWNGSSWSTLGAGFDGDVRALTVWNDGSGPALYAGGFLAPPGGPEFGLYRWSGGTWAGVGGGVFGGAVESLQVHDDGGGARLFVGGGFTSTGGTSSGALATWNGASWGAVGAAIPGNGVWNPVNCLLAHDDGSGPALFVGGYFAHAGNTSVSRIAKWTAAGWSPLGTGLSGQVCSSLARFDDGSGTALYAGGSFTQAGGVSVGNIARWNGSTWSALGTGPGLWGSSPEVYSLAVFDDGSGSALYAAGRFNMAGTNAALNIARWNGTAWSDVAGGLGVQFDYVRALVVFDDGSGPALFAAGNFDTAGGLPVSNIAKWDGANWTSVGGGLGAFPSAQTVHALAVYDDGNGLALYAGGEFDVAGGTPVASLARWNGTSWSALAGALAPDPNSSTPVVFSLRPCDLGNGQVLSVGGRFSAAGPLPASRIAQWNGAGWSTLGAGVGGTSVLLACQEVFDDGSGGGADLYVGGSFQSAGDVLSLDLGRWNGCAETFTSSCAGDGVSAPCPCANSGLAGHGCDNSAATGGSLLSAAGLANPDTVVLSASGELPSALSIFLQGDAQIAPTAFGDGLRCVGGHLKRLYVKGAVSGAVSAPQVGDPSIHARSAALGDTIPVAATRHYQVYYRDPNAGFCSAPTGGTFNVSNAIAIRW